MSVEELCTGHFQNSGQFPVLLFTHGCRSYRKFFPCKVKSWGESPAVSSSQLSQGHMVVGALGFTLVPVHCGSALPTCWGWVRKWEVLEGVQAALLLSLTIGWLGGPWEWGSEKKVLERKGRWSPAQVGEDPANYIGGTSYVSWLFILFISLLVYLFLWCED